MASVERASYTVLAGTQQVHNVPVQPLPARVHHSPVMPEHPERVGLPPAHAAPMHPPHATLVPHVVPGRVPPTHAAVLSLWYCQRGDNPDYMP